MKMSSNPALMKMREKWQARRRESQHFKSRVEMTTVCDAVLRDLDAVLAHREADVLTLPDAARLSGYSIQHLARLIRTRRIENAGRQGAPRIRRHDLPIKPGHLPDSDAPLQIEPASKEHVVRSFVTNSRRRGSET